MHKDPQGPECWCELLGRVGRPDVVGFALTYGSGTAIEPHTHPAHQLIHAISGAMRVVADGGIWFLPLGRALWIPAGWWHEVLTPTPTIAINFWYTSSDAAKATISRRVALARDAPPERVITY